MSFKYHPQGQRAWSKGRRWWRVIVSVVVALGFVAGLGYWVKKRPKK
jgi:hypothetical protein